MTFGVKSKKAELFSLYFRLGGLPDHTHEDYGNGNGYGSFLLHKAIFYTERKVYNILTSQR